MLGAQVTSVTVADVQAGRGFNRHAGWNLLVAWESPTVAWRHVSIFDGFDFVQVQGGQQLVVGPLDFSGFETPASGNVDAHAVTWTYEGDRAIVGDYLALGQLGVTCDQAGPHRIQRREPDRQLLQRQASSTGGVNVTGRTPAYVNQLGYDLDTLALPEGAIPNNANGAAACLGTVGDTYFFGGIAFDVLIRAPNVHIAKSADRSQAAPGDVVTYTTTVTNPPARADDPLYPTPTVPATNLVVTDVLPSGLDFVDFVSNPAGVLRLRARIARDPVCGRHARDRRDLQLHLPRPGQRRRAGPSGESARQRGLLPLQLGGSAGRDLHRLRRGDRGSAGRGVRRPGRRQDRLR